MPRTGRPPSNISRVSCKVALLSSHHEALEALDFDPFTEKRIYGARNSHLDRALQEYFEKYYPKLVKKSSSEAV